MSTVSTQSSAELVTHIDACYEPVSINEVQSGRFRSQLERVCPVCVDRLRLKRRESTDCLRKRKKHPAREEDISEVGDSLIIVPATLYSPRQTTDELIRMVIRREHTELSLFIIFIRLQQPLLVKRAKPTTIKPPFRDTISL
jgi:hypothetical protein